MVQVLSNILGNGFLESTRQGSSRWLTFPFLYSTKTFLREVGTYRGNIINQKKFLVSRIEGESVGGTCSFQATLLNFTKRSTFYDAYEALRPLEVPILASLVAFWRLESKLSSTDKSFFLMIIQVNSYPPIHPFIVPSFLCSFQKITQDIFSQQRDCATPYLVPSYHKVNRQH